MPVVLNYLIESYRPLVEEYGTLMLTHGMSSSWKFKERYRGALIMNPCKVNLNLI